MNLFLIFSAFLIFLDAGGLAYASIAQYEQLSDKKTVLSPDDEPGFIGKSDRFTFYSHFWLNMHHFLYNKAIALGEHKIEEIIENQIWNNLSEKNHLIFNEVLLYYSENIIDKDLRTSDYNSQFKRWVIQYKIKQTLPQHTVFESHIDQLNNFKSIYLEFYWDKHSDTNNEVYSKNIDLIKKYEQKFIHQLETLCKASWQSKPIRIDISYNSKRDIPYTTTHPSTHIVMDSKNTPAKEGVWLELLLHESSHHLISSRSGFVGGTINNVAQVEHLKIPSQLWHAYLFYFSGKVAKKFLGDEGAKDYKLYMEDNRFFGPMYPILEKHLPQYMENKESLAAATLKIINEISQKN